jgi:hypothetical protein
MKLLFENWRQYLKETEEISKESEIRKIKDTIEANGFNHRNIGHRMSMGRPLIDFSFDENSDMWYYTASIPNGDVIDSEGESLDDFLERVGNAYQLKLNLNEDLLEEGLWDTIKSDVAAVFMGIKPDATVGYLLGKLNDTDVIKNLKGKQLASFLSLSKKLQSKSTDAGGHAARQIEMMKRAAIEHPDLTLDEIIQNVSMKHVRTPGQRKTAVMQGLNSFLGNLAHATAEFQKAEPTPGLAEKNMKPLFENWRKYIQEDLYYGTSTIFQEEIAKNGIKAPSEWGSYGLAEENAVKVVSKYGGEPMVIQMSISEFENKSLTLKENYDKMYIYTDKLNINIRKQEKINL